jgi:hypothetical protein
MARFELPKWGRNLHSGSHDDLPKIPLRNRIEPESAHRVIYDDRSHPAAEDSIKYSGERNNIVRSGSNAVYPTGAFPSAMKSAAADLCGPEEEPGRRPPLDEIADALRLLTYGEMLELAEAMWKVNPQGAEITEPNLAAVLYRWSTSRSVG